MKIGYRRSLSNLLFVALGILSLLFLVGYIKTGQLRLDFLTILGLVIVTILAVLYRTRPYFEVKGDHIVLYSLARRKTQRMWFQSKDDFDLIDNRLYIHQNGERKRVPITANLIQLEDWQALLQYLALDRTMEKDA